MRWQSSQGYAQPHWDVKPPRCAVSSSFLSFLLEETQSLRNRQPFDGTPLSIAVSIAGLVSLAGSLFRVVCQHGVEVKEFKKEVNQLQSEVKRLSFLLRELSLLATSLETEPLDNTFRLEHATVRKLSMRSRLNSRKLDQARPAPLGLSLQSPG
ncbi:hypothetical protein BJX68DRAFT_262595 [Aspergillus pseudodeflectus]|uniref:Fungal N-terminal domain-containing protein n=1 Tax=Aspergillus pseudodeflectus TaxID=176178 RepID=A0ABR4L3E9_9EURO